MNTTRFRQYFDEGLISEEAYKKVVLTESTKHFSVHWELRTLLYLGVLLLSGGLGILVYKNIDTIGHDVIIGLIAIACGGCFWYGQKHKRPFSLAKVEAPNSFFDYIILLGCLLLVTLVAYVQFQYTLFGTHYGLAVFVPVVGLFFCAYYFDHIGILSMAVTNLAAWVGVALTPFAILGANAFNDPSFLLKALLLAALLILAGWVSKARDLKAHFAFTYNNFGLHLALISAYAGMYLPESLYGLWFLLMAAIGAYYYWLAFKEGSFYFLVMIALYLYLGISTLLIMFIISTNVNDIGWIYLMLLYFIGSALGLIFLLIYWHKQIKKLHAGIQ